MGERGKWEEGLLGKVKPKCSLFPFEAVRALRFPPENETEPSRLDLRKERTSKGMGRGATGPVGRRHLCWEVSRGRWWQGRSFSMNFPRTVRQSPEAGE